MTLDKAELRCPCCNQTITAPLVHKLKDQINAELNKMTTARMPLEIFLSKAWDLLRSYDFREQEIADCLDFHPISNQPGETRNPYAKWDSTLVLQWCYNKIEVAYFS